MIEIRRSPLYSHWAIYEGDGYVIHVTSADDYPRSGKNNKAVVKRDLLKDVAGSCKYQINNYLDGKLKPLPVNEILSAAKRKIGERIKYNLIIRNCEHFATFLRYRFPFCEQVIRAMFFVFPRFIKKILMSIFYKIVDWKFIQSCIEKTHQLSRFLPSP